MTWILMVGIWSSSPFYGYDYIPTLEFKNENKCLELVKEIKSKNSSSRAYCYGMTARHANKD